MKDFYVFVVFLITVVSLFQILKHKLGIRNHSGGSATDWHDDPRTRAIYTDVKNLQERVRTLERITVERENSLAREIDDLRNR